MNTKADIEDNAPITITVQLVDRTLFDDHDSIAERLTFKDIDGNEILLTLFHSNDATDYDWTINQWYRLEDAGGNVHNGNPQLNANWDDMTIVPLDEPPAEAATDETAANTDSNTTTTPDSGSQPAVQRQADITPGNYLLHAYSPTQLSSVTVQKYRLELEDGLGREEDPQSVTNKAAWVQYRRTGTPTVSAGPMTVYALEELPDSLSLDAHEVTFTHTGTAELQPDSADHQRLERLLRQDFQTAVPSTYQYEGIDTIIGSEAVFSADGSYGFTAYYRYNVSITLTASGDVLYHVEVSHHTRSDSTIADLLAADVDIRGLKAEHDPDRYSEPGSGTIEGLSEYRYTDYIPEIGSSIYDLHRNRGRSTEALREQFREENPYLVAIDYGSGTRYQLPQFLRAAPTLDQVEALNETYHQRLSQKKQSMLPPMRVTAAREFIADLTGLDGFGLDIQPGPTNRGYSEADVGTPKANLEFGGGNTGYYPKQDLATHGVCQAPSPFRILYLYPDAYADIAEPFGETVTDGLDALGAPADQLLSEAYQLAGDISYSTVGTDRVNDADVALVVVPEPSDLPTGVEDSFDELKRVLMRDGIFSQMVRKPTVEDIARTAGGLGNDTFLNILAGLIAKAEGTAWTVADIPGDADAFMGLDVTYDADSDAHLGASASVVFADGTTYAARSRTPQEGERFTTGDVAQFVRDLLRTFVQEHGREFSHLVIHRDGYVNEDVDAILDELDALDATIDIVGIRKSGAPRIAEYDGSSFEIADKGTAFLNHEQDHSILATTGTPEYREQNAVGTPRPLQLYHVAGETDLETLTGQVYWLSEAHVGSVSRSCRNPVTIEYADKCAEAAREGFVPSDQLVRGAVFI